jgi:Transposase DDE domain
LLYGSNEESKSLNQCAIEAKNKHELSISKQGLDQRFNAQSVLFIKTMFEEQFKTQITSEVSSKVLNKFNRVLIKDSTRFDIAEQHKESYPGSGGSASEAGISIQYEFDLKDGKVTDINLTSSIDQDSTDASRTQDKIGKNDLIIRDLGYFVLDVFEYVQKSKAFFLSRLEPRVLIYQKKNGSIAQLSYNDLYQQMIKSQQTTMEIDALIGEKKKLQVRLIVNLLPEEVYNERMRRLNKRYQKKGKKISERYKEYARFNFYITNIPLETVSSTEILLLYRLRWQIELVFKVWKSIFKIEKIRKMKLERFLSLLYAKLLWVLINWEIVMTLKSIFHKEFNKILSMHKSFQTIKENFEKLRTHLLNYKTRGYIIVNWLIEILSEKHWLETRKNRIGYENILFKNL